MKHGSLSPSKLPNYAVILAGGMGSRFGSEEPKQFVRLGGVPIFIRTTKLLLNTGFFTRVLLVVHPDHIDRAQKLIEQYFSNPQILIVSGGQTRTESVKLAINALADEKEGVVLIHDAVRPFLEIQTVKLGLDIIQNGEADGVNTTISSPDTLVRINLDSNLIAEVPKRIEYLRGQTPQFFLLRKLREAFAVAFNFNHEFTEECGLILAAFPDSKILCIEGSERNIKITSKQDLVTAQNLLRMPSPIVSTHKSTNFRNVGVIGGSRGLGLQLKTVLESQGVNVKSFSRREGQDINELVGRKTMIDWLSNLEGKAHLVFTVGSIQNESILNLNEESLISQFKTNLISIMVCISEALQVAQAKIESIVLIGSTAGVEGRESLISYSSSKAGLVAFMQATSDELMSLGIRINIIVPERIRSELRKEKFLQEDSSYLEELEVVEVILECLTKSHHGNVFSVRKI